MDLGFRSELNSGLFERKESSKTQDMIKYKGYTEVNFFVKSVFAVLFLTSCIKDGSGDCFVVIRFEYNYNMLNSNAFGDQADTIFLFIFDEQGRLVRRIDDGGKQITNEYTIALNDLPASDYQFVVWAKGNQYKKAQSDFILPAARYETSGIDMQYAVLKTESGKYGYAMNNLLVGYTPVRHVNSSTQNVVTVETKKVNNTVRVVLIDRKNNALEKDSYRISIEDPQGNGLIKYDYSVLPESGSITYRPYYKEKIEPERAEMIHPGLDADNAIVSELALSRIIDDPDISLTIRDQNDEVVMRYRLIDLIKLVELNERRLGWSFQEYLDRQDKYSITLYIDKLISTIIINGWVINDAQIDF